MRKCFTMLCAAAVLVLVVSIGSIPAHANGFSATAFVQPTDLSGFQQFGTGVAADGPIMAAATRETSISNGAVANAPGVVYVFANVNNTWNQEAELTGDGIVGERFGTSLAVKGNLLLVGAPGAFGPNGQTGAVFLYTNNNGVWTQQGKLFPAGATGIIGFGAGLINGIATDGSTLVIGAGGDSGTGAAYIYVNNGGTWVQQARITPDDPLAAGFGASVSLSGDTLLVGAQETNTTQVSRPGAAFVFTRQNGVWTQQARLDPTFPAAFGNFGESVSLDGTTAVVGAGAANDAYVYLETNGTWTLQAHLTPPDGLDDVDFGTSLKVIGDLLLVGAYEDINSDGIGTGTAYVYTRGGSTWTEHPELRMAPGINGLAGPEQDNERFANFVTMTKLGSQTIFVMAAHALNGAGFDPQDPSTWPTTKVVGAVYTTTLN